LLNSSVKCEKHGNELSKVNYSNNCIKCEVDLINAKLRTQAVPQLVGMLPDTR